MKQGTVDGIKVIQAQLGARGVATTDYSFKLK